MAVYGEPRWPNTTNWEWRDDYQQGWKDAMAQKPAEAPESDPTPLVKDGGTQSWVNGIETRIEAGIVVNQALDAKTIHAVQDAMRWYGRKVIAGEHHEH